MSTTHLNHRDAARLAERIAARRCELDLTPGEAAARAGVSTSTWTKYETAGRIGDAKVAGVCRAMQWADLTGVPAPYRDQPDRLGWSLAIALKLGDECAVDYADAGDAVLEAVERDLEALSALPSGTHLGQLDRSSLRELLPGCALVRYDYEFVFALRGAVEQARTEVRNRAASSTAGLFRGESGWSRYGSPDATLALGHRVIVERTGRSRDALARELDSCGIGSAESLVRRLLDDRDRLRHSDDEHGPHLCWQCVIEVERRHLDRRQAQLTTNYAEWEGHRDVEPFTEGTGRLPF
ncbi:MAG: helix-turn-helix transcriptional regulator [Microbacteriaceae bacterium]|nr:helix-turn-helix transcriptional regulator [Microbacteriaceae bacterium]